MNSRSMGIFLRMIRLGIEEVRTGGAEPARVKILDGLLVDFISFLFLFLPSCGRVFASPLHGSRFAN